jgi:demethylmenaquinone methyltransferase/2-methoxy-6-polyprenyl-1,4-benzoquinol methylase
MRRACGARPGEHRHARRSRSGYAEQNSKSTSQLKRLLQEVCGTEAAECMGAGARLLVGTVGAAVGDDSPTDCEPTHTVRRSPTRKDHARTLFAGLPRHYDRTGAALSFGQDPRWRRAMVGAVSARRGERILDVATGTGLVAAALARRYGAAVVGIDQSPEMLASARARHPDAATYVAGEAEHLPFADAEFDHLTFTYLLRYVDDPAATLVELARVVKPGGRIASLEFGIPERAPLRTLWRIYTRVGLPALGRAVSPAWAEAGRFLAHSIPDFYARNPLAAQLAMWDAAGIEDMHVRRMSFGAGVVIWGTRAGAPVSAD